MTLQLKHGGGSQAIRLPTDKLEQNKKYYVRYSIDCVIKKIYFSKFEILKNKFIFSVSHLNLGAVVDPF